MGRGIWDPQPLLRLAPLLQGLVQANTWVVLRDLWPGVRYHIQVRSKPDGTSMDGVWGPWSQTVAAETPHSSGERPSPPLGCWQAQWGGTHTWGCEWWGSWGRQGAAPRF